MGNVGDGYSVTNLDFSKVFANRHVACDASLLVGSLDDNLGGGLVAPASRFTGVKRELCQIRWGGSQNSSKLVARQNCEPTNFIQ